MSSYHKYPLPHREPRNDWWVRVKIFLFCGATHGFNHGLVWGHKIFVGSKIGSVC